MIVSPCISICKTDPQTGYCYGCARTNEEKKLNLKHLNQGIYALNFNGLANSQTLFFVIIH